MVGVVPINARTAHDVRLVCVGIDRISNALLVERAIEYQSRSFWGALHSLPLLAVHGGQFAKTVRTRHGGIGHLRGEKIVGIQGKLLCLSDESSRDQGQNERLFHNGRLIANYSDSAAVTRFPVAEQQIVVGSIG